MKISLVSDRAVHCTNALTIPLAVIAPNVFLSRNGKSVKIVDDKGVTTKYSMIPRPQPLSTRRLQEHMGLLPNKANPNCQNYALYWAIRVSLEFSSVGAD
jgi:hypothetical protein